MPTNGLKVPTVATLVFLCSIAAALEKGQLLDMSYGFGVTTLYWPGQTSFKLDIQVRGPSGSLPWYETNAFSGPEHGGTHVDAPAHFAEGQLRVDDIPIDKLVGQAVRVDISDKARANRDYEMTSQDLQDWEEANGKIPDGSLLFVYTGWGAYYPNRTAYFGSDRNDTYLDDQGKSMLHFPGVAPEAASWLLDNDRRISGLGIDTPSIDHGQSTDFMTHQILFGADVYGIENVANLNGLPTTGARAYVLPMKIEEGSGAPARIVAMLADESTSAVATVSPSAHTIFASTFALILLALM